MASNTPLIKPVFETSAFLFIDIKICLLSIEATPVGNVPSPVIYWSGPNISLRISTEVFTLEGVSEYNISYVLLDEKLATAYKPKAFDPDKGEPGKLKLLLLSIMNLKAGLPFSVTKDPEETIKG